MMAPAELASRRQWLVWKLIQKPGDKKPSKIPFYATTGNPRGWPNGKPRDGKPTDDQPQVDQGHELDRQHLVTFNEAILAATGRFDGVGIAFLPGDDLIGVDLDGMFDPDTGEIDERASKVIGVFGTYTEYSPSGTGFHIIGYGQTQTNKSNDIGVEMFCGRQFFTWTGKQFNDNQVTTIPEKAIVGLHAWINRAKDAARQARQPAAPAQPASTMPAAVQTDDRATKYVMGALNKACQVIATTSEGGRNNLLNEEAFQIAGYVGAGLISEAMAYQALFEAARQCGLTDVEITPTLQSAFRAGKQVPKQVPAPDPARAPRQHRQQAEQPKVVTSGLSTQQAPANDNPPRELTLSKLESSIRPLGYNRGRFYYLSHSQRQVVELTPTNHNKNYLIQMAPLEVWESIYGNPDNHGAVSSAGWTTATNQLMRLCERVGVFEAGLIRGRGCWIDEGDTIMHLGDRVLRNGKEQKLDEIKSRHIYEAGSKLRGPSKEPLTLAEANRVLEISKRFNWEMEASAALLAGWVVMAPICGSLEWRPHIWLTGGTGTGKTTILNEFIAPLMAGMELPVMGNSTEAGIRQTLRADALPVLFDETEQNDEREENRVQGVLSLIRQASSESPARTLKGTVGGQSMAFHVRSMFCLASIQVGIKRQADHTRISVLSLYGNQQVKPEDSQAHQQKWIETDGMLSKLRGDKEYASRLLARSILMQPVIIANMAVMQSVTARLLQSQRLGDQYGTLLAGTATLIYDRPITEAEAEKLVLSFEWNAHIEASQEDESIAAFSSIMQVQIRVDGEEAAETATIGELVLIASTSEGATHNLTPRVAKAHLGRYAIKTEEGYVWIGNNSDQLQDKLKGKPWSVDWMRYLRRINGHKATAKAIRFAPGVVQRGTGIPLSYLKM